MIDLNWKDDLKKFDMIQKQFGIILYDNLLSYENSVVIEYN